MGVNVPVQMTVRKFAEELNRLIAENPDTSALDQPLSIDLNGGDITVREIEIIDVTDECQGCDNPKCAYGVEYTKTSEAPADLKDEGIHFRFQVWSDS